MPPRPPTSPRPILKSPPPDTDPNSPLTSPLPFSACSQSQLQAHSPHVHFPPTPRLARAGITHSPNTYDRAPIVVLPNDCEIPHRGGRSYGDGNGDGAGDEVVGDNDESGVDREAGGVLRAARRQRRRRHCDKRGLDSGGSSSSNRSEGYFHPRAFGAGRLLNSGDDDDDVADMLNLRYPPSPALPVFRDPADGERTPASTSTSTSMPSPTGTSTFNALALTLLPVTQSSPASPSLEKPPKKKRSTSRLSGKVDRIGGAYTRWSVDPNSRGGDPSLDGCLGGF